MKRFRIYAKSIAYLYADVEAEDEDEAYEMYDNMDGGAFSIEYENWEFDGIVERKEVTE